MEIFLAKVMGLYLMITGVVVLSRRRVLQAAISEFAHDRALITVVALIELLVGLSLVVAFPALSFTLAGFVSLIGWIMVIESVLYMVLPPRGIRSLIASFNTPLWYTVGGIISIAIGGAVSAVAFGLL